MANYEATRYDWDGEYLTGVQGVNTGLIIPWSSASLPSGFLECNGQAVSQATYAALFAVIGTTYGDPGGGNFNLPDLRDRLSISKSNTQAIASTGGANTVTPTGNATASLSDTTLTTVQLPSHTHTYLLCMAGGMSVPGGSSSNAQNMATATGGQAGSGQGHGHTVSSVAFVGDSTSILQPYLTLVYIIKT
jgi:microcystin-dependent protein